MGLHNNGASDPSRLKSRPEGGPRLIFDIETDGLNPTRIWVIVCKDITTGERHVFRRPDLAPGDFTRLFNSAEFVCGHNIIDFDLPAILRLVPGVQRPPAVVDTLVLSRLLDQPRLGGHSLRSWGVTLGLDKGEYSDWSQLTDEMVEYCENDVEVSYLLYRRFEKYLNAPRWKASIDVEHFIAERCRELHDNGFYFSLDKAVDLRYNIRQELEKLDFELLSAFPPKVVAVREVHPRATKFGTLNKSDFRFVHDGDLTPYSVGSPFTLIRYEEFNPSSTPQIVERLNDAGWKPVEKTKGHLQAIRDGDEERIKKFAVSGWMVSETNLNTLPDTAPAAAKKLARRIMLASRERTLTEWIDAYNRSTGRIHGSFNGIGAWTHRMSHTKPNTGNIAREDALYGSEMRSMWASPEGAYLVGVDAESIQLRVLAHYINDQQFTASLLSGRKEDGTDPHSLNKVALGRPCKSRNHAKTFIYAWLLGAGVSKVAQILECSYEEARKAVSDFIEFYPGLKHVKEDIIPADAARGYFEGFDGRYVKIVGEDKSSKEHFALAGYLQNGETVVMKHAMQIWHPKLISMGIPFKIVNFVHDEWQTEVYSHEHGVIVGEIQADAIREAGEALGLRCPMAGSVLSGHGGLAIGRNWLETH